MSGWTPRMQKAVGHLEEQLRAIRVGSLSPGFVETFRINTDGGAAALSRIAAVTRQGDRILVRPFDSAHVPAIVRDLGAGRLNAYALNPSTVAVAVPSLSVEQRQDMARQVKALGEEARVAVRMIRQDVRKALSSRARVPERSIQTDTDSAIAEIDRLIRAKLDAIGA